MDSINGGQERCTLEFMMDSDIDWHLYVDATLDELGLELFDGPTNYREDVLNSNSITVGLQFFNRDDGEKFLLHISENKDVKIKWQTSSVICDQRVNSEELEECISSITEQNKESIKRQNEKCKKRQDEFDEALKLGRQSDDEEKLCKEATSQLEVFQDVAKKIEARCQELRMRFESSASSDSSATSKNPGLVTKRELLELECYAKHEQHMLETALPIYASRAKIIKAIKENQVTIVMGATGCGKSTQLVQYMLRDIEVVAATRTAVDKKSSRKMNNLSNQVKRRLFVCSEPRKVVACSLQRHVQNEIGDMDTVAYDAGNISTRKKDSSTTRITFITHHALLTRLVGELASAKEKSADSFLDECAVIIIDEAHERTIYSDMLIGLLRRALIRKPDLKLVIMSATLQIDEFMQYFNRSVEIQVPGRTYPIEMKYVSPENSAIASVKSREIVNDDEQEDYVMQAVLQTKAMHETGLKNYDRIDKDKGPAGILVFLTSPDECEEALRLLVAQLTESPKRNEASIEQQRFEGPTFVGYCLHGELSPQEQQRLFEKVAPGKRKIVFATNVAETSVTIPEIGCVIDCGLSKQKRYDSERRMHVLEKQPIARSAAEQRKGRAGRTRQGLCLRLYTENEFKELRECDLPEILRTHLGIPLLLLFRLGMKIEEIMSNKEDNETFRFVRQPNKASVDDALKDLVRIGGYDETNKCLTEHGQKMAQLVTEIEIELANLVLLAIKQEVGYEAIILAAMLSVQPNKLFILRSGWMNNNDVHSASRTQSKHNISLRERVAVLKRDFAHPKSDMLTLINVFRKWDLQDEDKRDQWCRKHSISVKLMRLANDIYTRLNTFLYRKLKIDLTAPDEENINRNYDTLREVIFKTYAPQIAKLQRQPPSTLPHATAEYLRCDTKTITSVHYSSLVDENGTQRTKWPNWIVFEHVLEIPGRDAYSFMVNCTEIDQKWLLEPEPTLRKVLSCVQPFLGGAGGADGSEVKVNSPMLLARFVGRDRQRLREINVHVNKPYPNAPIEVKPMPDGRILIIAPEEMRADAQIYVIKVLKELDPDWKES